MPELTPAKLFSTGEVMAHTGLSRQTLHNYKRLGLIIPAKWTKAGHCYYDESVFERLRKIKIFQRHRSLANIKHVLDGSEAAQARPDDATRTDATDATTMARGLREGTASPEQRYRIGDVMRITGISRQTLHNYTIQGLIEAHERTPAGHRLYGEDVFQSLRLIGIFKRHRRFHEVQLLIEEWRRFGHPQSGSGRAANSTLKNPGQATEVRGNEGDAPPISGD